MTALDLAAEAGPRERSMQDERKSPKTMATYRG